MPGRNIFVRPSSVAGFEPATSEGVKPARPRLPGSRLGRRARALGSRHRRLLVAGAKREPPPALRREGRALCQSCGWALGTASASTPEGCELLEPGTGPPGEQEVTGGDGLGELVTARRAEAEGLLRSPQ
jgi:hypothetical protein